MKGLNKFFDSANQQIRLLLVKVKQNKKAIIPIMIALFVIIFICVTAYALFYIQSTRQANIDPPTFTTPTLDAASLSRLSGGEITATPAYTSTPQPTPTPSNQWIVKENSETVQIGKYVYAVVTFENVSTHETKRGQCQQPKWLLPEIGHLYTLNNTFSDYWLFIPIEGVSDQKYQRFAVIN